MFQVLFEKFKQPVEFKNQIIYLEHELKFGDKRLTIAQAKEDIEKAHLKGCVFEKATVLEVLF